ncbi:MAG: ATP synthase subunit I [Acidobacteria bacterium]|nr:ATP synthase subunit I [Acidobacteriota bacterium]
MNLKNIFSSAFEGLWNDEDSMVRDTGRVSIIITILGTAVLTPVFGLWFGLTFFLSAAVMLINFIWLKEIITMLTNRAAKSEKVKTNPFKYLFRFILIGCFLYVILSARELNTFALLLGLSVLVIGVTAVSIKTLINLSEND